MGVYIWIRRTSGVREELHEPTYQEAMDVFDAFPWTADIAAYEEIVDTPDDPKEDYQPEFGLMDDTGRRLLICAYSNEKAAFTFVYPNNAEHFGIPEENLWKFTNNLSRLDVPRLVRSFFDSNYEDIFWILEQYPSLPEAQESKRNKILHPLIR
ncbi:MAG: hypothetical protein ABI443_12005 [Chthoniobacterales bacterium]